MEVKKQNKFALFAIIGLFAIVVLLLTDILIGMSNIGFKDIIDSIFNYNKSKEHLIITTISPAPKNAHNIFILYPNCGRNTMIITTAKVAPEFIPKT